METTTVRTHTKSTLWTRIPARGKMVFAAFRSDLERFAPTQIKNQCPNCTSSFGLQEFKNFIEHKDLETVKVGWELECSNCKVSIEILNDVEE